MEKFFEIHSTVRDEEVAVIVTHLTETFSLIAQSTGTDVAGLPAIPVHIFQTSWQIKDFLDRQTAIEVAKMEEFSGVCWFDEDRGRPAIATSVEDRPLSAVFQILQHELYHCFEYLRFGAPMDPWLSEGHAQSFEDFILLGGSAIAGRVNAGRIERLRYARARKETMPPQILLMTVPDHLNGWSRLDPAQMTRFYDQAWAMVHFLNTEFTASWSLIDFVKSAETAPPLQALADGLGGQVSIPEFLESFDHWVDSVLPDPLSVAIDKLEIISGWMLGVSGERSLSGMQSVEKLRLLGSLFQVKNFCAGRDSVHLSDHGLYRYEPEAGREPVIFETLPEESPDSLPRLRASGFPQLDGGSVTLSWYPGRLGPIPDFQYRTGTGN